MIQKTKLGASKLHLKSMLARAVVAVPLGASLGLTLAAGCASSHETWHRTVNNETRAVDFVSGQIDHPAPAIVEQVSFSPAPVTVESGDIEDLIYVDQTLGQVIETALRNSEVIRDIGGRVLRSPDTVRTNLANDLQQIDPQFGMEAALSAFDAQLSASTIFSNNDRIFNNRLFAGGTNSFQQDLHEYQIELAKRTATGSTVALRSMTQYDANNAPANTFISSFDTTLEGELRQPLLQGGGLEFNRIAGPGSQPGVYNGVLIARANFDVNEADFDIAIRDFMSNVENAYWDLYLAYRELDAKKKSMEQSLVIWNESKSQASGEIINKAQEALARQHYYRLKSDFEETLSGHLIPGTQTRNGSTGGTLQSSGGVLAAERRLRLLIGLPANDGTVIRPADEPPMAKIPFNWDISLQEAMSQRPELRRQNATVKMRELELLASKNFLNPRLDAVGRYRYRGFGDDFLGGGSQVGNEPASSVGKLLTGDQQEWSVGLEMSMPVGFRRAHAGVTHAELSLSRARAIHREQQRTILSELSAGFADADRAFQQIQNKLNQFLAAKEYYIALRTQKEEQGASVTVDRMIDAQERYVEAEVDFFHARAEYAVALKNIHYEKGTLLAYKDLRVAESYADVVPSSVAPSIAPPEPAAEGVPLPDAPEPAAELTDVQATDQPLSDVAAIESLTEPITEDLGQFADAASIEPATESIDTELVLPLDDQTPAEEFSPIDLNEFAFESILTDQFEADVPAVDVSLPADVPAWVDSIPPLERYDSVGSTDKIKPADETPIMPPAVVESAIVETAIVETAIVESAGNPFAEIMKAGPAEHLPQPVTASNGEVILDLKPFLAPEEANAAVPVSYDTTAEAADDAMQHKPFRVRLDSPQPATAAPARQQSKDPATIRWDQMFLELPQQ